jgi:hypothetical protein
MVWLKEWAEDRLSWVKAPYSMAVWADERHAIYSTCDKIDQPIRLGCLQDFLLGILASQLEHEGHFSLSQSAIEFLPQQLVASTFGGQLTLSHLLARASGVWNGKPLTAGATVDLDDWSAFERYCCPIDPQFAPGSLVTHTLFERLLFLRIVTIATRRDPYAILSERLFPSGPAFLVEKPQTPFQRCYRELISSVGDLCSLLNQPVAGRWMERLVSSEEVYPIARHDNVKPWAPIGSLLGLFKLGNGLWGQDGDNPTGDHVGIRLHPSRRIAVIGSFPSLFLRDQILSHLCSDLMGVAPPTREGTHGNLRGVAASDLVGTYHGTLGHQLRISIDGQDISIKMGPSDTSIALRIEESGDLTGRWISNNLWIEPLELDEGRQLVLAFGRNPYLKSQDCSELSIQ